MVNYLSTPVGEPIRKMATKVGLGVPMPLLAPATATWALPFAAYYMYLQNRIVLRRLGTKSFLGDQTAGEAGDKNKDPLFIATRAQSNFIENVPLVLAVALLAELNGANRTYINSALATLFALRVGHADFGMFVQNALGVGRPVGYYGTQAVLASLAGYTAYLIRGYWQI